MKESLYIQATRSALRFTWQNKIVWIFGIFAALLGQFGIVEFLGKVGLATGDVDKYFGNLGYLGSQLGQLSTNMSLSFDNKLLVLFLLVLVAGLVAIFVFASIVSQGAIIHLAAQSIKNKRVNITKAWHIGSANFWRLFVVNFFRKLFIAFLAMMVSLAAFGALVVPSAVNNLFFLVIFLLASVVGIILSFLVVYAAAYIVVEKYSVAEAVKAALVLFRKHWLVSIEVGLIVLVYNLFLGLFIALGFTLIILPAILLWFAVILIGGNQLLLAGGFVAALIFFTMYLIVVGAGFTVFTTYIWTFIFMKMHKVGLKSRLLHYLSYKKRKK